MLRATSEACSTQEQPAPAHEILAATRIQAFLRGRKARKRLQYARAALRRRAVCLTERDRATLEDHGARARATVPVILVALDA